MNIARSFPRYALAFITAFVMQLYGSTPALAAAISGDAANVSSNWSGYVADTGAFTGVGASWQVPSPSLASSWTSTDATWVGIGGETTRDLIQAGTQAIIENGSATYQAWYELLPSYQHIIPLTIHGGDSVTVSLVETTPGSWHLAFADTTTGQSYARDLAYSSSHSSAEWIEEMPATVAGRSLSFLPLDDFGSVQFTNGFAIDNGTRVSIAAANAQQLTMGVRGRTLATPSQLSGDTFTVNRSNNASGIPPAASYAAASAPVAVSSDGDGDDDAPVSITRYRLRRGRAGWGNAIIIMKEW